MCLLSLKVHTEEARSQGAIMLIFSTNRVHKYMTSAGKAEEIMADREERERERECRVAEIIETAVLWALKAV